MQELSMQQKLQIQIEIKKFEGELIKKAKELIDCPYIYKSRKENNKTKEWYEKYDPKIHTDDPAKYYIYGYDKHKKEILKENQIRNVLDATLQVDCVEVIILFIQYQIGRNENWNLGGFGDSLINQINELGKKAGEIAVFSKIKADIEPIWLQLTRLYLGHLNRYFYYKKKEGE